MFSGEVFNGEEAKDIGLVDEVGSMINILQDKYPGSKLQHEDPSSRFKNLF